MQDVSSSLIPSSRLLGKMAHPLQGASICSLASHPVPVARSLPSRRSRNSGSKSWKCHKGSSPQTRSVRRSLGGDLTGAVASVLPRLHLRPIFR